MPCAAKMSHLKILQGTGNDKRVSSRNAPKKRCSRLLLCAIFFFFFFFFFFFLELKKNKIFFFFFFFFFFFLQLPKLKIVILFRKENSEEVKKEREGQIFLGDRSLRKYDCFVVLACEPQLPQPHPPGESLLGG